MISCNHIHRREHGDWVCGRSLAFDDMELLHCEARNPDLAEACRNCAEQVLAHFGDAILVQ